jgi:hypothetical protein
MLHGVGVASGQEQQAEHQAEGQQAAYGNHFLEDSPRGCISRGPQQQRQAHEDERDRNEIVASFRH